jgi:hypothetical protein
MGIGLKEDFFNVTTQEVNTLEKSYNVKCDSLKFDSAIVFDFLEHDNKSHQFAWAIQKFIKEKITGNVNENLLNNFWTFNDKGLILQNIYFNGNNIENTTNTVTVNFHAWTDFNILKVQIITTKSTIVEKIKYVYRVDK